MTREGTDDLMTAMEKALSSQMEFISCIISYNDVTLLSTVHNLGILDEVLYQVTSWPIYLLMFVV
jgi:50S ribosomal subunit-associated GTPase HflX